MNEITNGFLSKCLPPQQCWPANWLQRTLGAFHKEKRKTCILMHFLGHLRRVLFCCMLSGIIKDNCSEQQQLNRLILVDFQIVERKDDSGLSAVNWIKLLCHVAAISMVFVSLRSGPKASSFILF